MINKVVVITIDDERIVHWFETLDEAEKVAERLAVLSTVKSADAFQ